LPRNGEEKAIAAQPLSKNAFKVINNERKMSMSIKLKEENDGKVLEAQISGKLVHGDYESLSPEFEKLVKEHGKISVLFEMVDFHGWETAALWDDIKFDVKHFDHIERLAMVGDRKWEKGMSKFCGAFTTASIRYFDRSEKNEARQWLEAA
jgi:SpoIIAA-like